MGAQDIESKPLAFSNKVTEMPNFSSSLAQAKPKFIFKRLHTSKPCATRDYLKFQRPRLPKKTSKHLGEQTFL